jgi:O-antigen ligase
MLGFFLFLMVNATLFIRPAEIVPELLGLPIYNIFILSCLTCAFPLVLHQLQSDSLVSSPISLCVVGLLGSVFMSHFSHLNLSASLNSTSLFVKVVLYFLLLVGLVDSMKRLRSLLFWVGWMILVLTALALLQYHEIINVPALASYAEAQYDHDGNVMGEIVRLCSTGIYNNPNSLSRILVTGILVSLYWLGDRRSGPLRLIWLAPLAIEAYALSLTHSRGGFMGLITAVLCLLYARFGAKTATLLTVLCLPVMLVFKGRQTNITISEGTGHQRLEIWAEGWTLFRQSPIFGIGMDQFAEEIHYVAHNSFFHSFAELGVIGGSFFAGMFYLGIRWPLRLGTVGSPIRDPDFRRLGCFLSAILAGEAVGQLSITRCYDVPTYLLTGLAAAYLRVAARNFGAKTPEVNFRLVLEVGSVSMALLFFLFLLMKL